jgi:beta-phosphoglucomutase family hydrolase
MRIILPALSQGYGWRHYAADLSCFGEGRQLDDKAHILMRNTGGVKGMLSASSLREGAKPMNLQIPNGEFSGYIFDCDGTLADTMPLHYRAWARIVAELGGELSESQFYQLGGKPTEQILELLREEHGLHVKDVGHAAARKEEYFMEMIHEVKPIEPVVNIARQLRGFKPMAVASGGFRQQIEQTLDLLGIRSLFDVVVCVEDYVRGKPFPDPFLEAARRLKVVPAECLVFEDSQLGIDAAHSAGMQCVFVPRLDQDPQELLI